MKPSSSKAFRHLLLFLTIVFITDCQTSKDPTPANTGGTSSPSGGNSGGTNSPQTGTVTFFTREDLGVGIVSVYVEGNLEGSISHYHSGGVTCGQGDVNVMKAAGTYSFKATGGNQVWQGTITIKNGVCLTQELGKGSSSGGPTSSQGQVTFWTAQSSGWSTIDISVGGSFVGTINKYYSSVPSCGASGCVTITKAPGTYAFTAQSDKGDKWTGNVTVSANGCATNQLTFASGGGPSTSSCDWDTWSKYIKVTRYEFDQKGSYCGSAKGITYLEVQNLSSIDLSIDFCLKQPDGTWYCAFVDTGAGQLMKTNNCGKASDLKVWARPFGKASTCPFPKP